MNTGNDFRLQSIPPLPPIVQNLPKPEKFQDKRPKKRERLRLRGFMISDTHFGSLVHLAACLAACLDHIRRPKYIIIDGDFIDFWSCGGNLVLGRQVFSDPEITVMQQISRFDYKGTQVTFIPGNHDSLFRTFARLIDGYSSRIFGRHLHILREAVYRTADDRHFLVLHGDEFDPVVTKRQKLSQTATKIFDWMVYAGAGWDSLRNNNAAVNAVSRYLQLPSAGQTLNGIKASFDRATRTPDYQRKQIERLFSHNAAVFAYRRKYPDLPPPPYLDGMICGHTHCAGLWSATSPLDKESGQSMGPQKVLVYDIGHWTGPYEEDRNPPSCTALVEHLDGSLQIMRWTPDATMVPVDIPEQSLDSLLSLAANDNGAAQPWRKRAANKIVEALRRSMA